MIYAVYILINHVWHCVYLYVGQDDDVINRSYHLAKVASQWYQTKLVRTFGDNETVKITDF